MKLLIINDLKLLIGSVYYIILCHFNEIIIIKCDSTKYWQFKVFFITKNLKNNTGYFLILFGTS